MHRIAVPTALASSILALASRGTLLQDPCPVGLPGAFNQQSQWMWHVFNSSTVRSAPSHAHSHKQ
eukprot:994807-Prorocentrum_lima.AAC.1